ncbi:MAG: hypothetical protein E7387_07760 [Ruminococcaceae bacterium]|nr:hypothetical protein [Oscillospiraceae bacterium]
MKKSKRVELPLVEPLYSTYHYQGTCTAILASNPTIRNWSLNQIMSLSCNRKFLKGFTSPEITVDKSSWGWCPHLIKINVSSQFEKRNINSVIRELIDNGFYIVFENVDDYYVEGKTWYKERHFNHDGLICGYDQNNKTYCIYAYDSNWIYRKFWTPQKAFNAGRAAMLKQGVSTIFYAVKAMDDIVDFSPRIVCDNIKEYLDSDLEKYPFEGEDDVYGIVVHEYIAEYVSKLYRGDIPYERMDRRVFRLIWEHKKAMLERIKLVEEKLGMNTDISQKYAVLVGEADTMRILYAAHHMKRRDPVLPVIQSKVLQLMEDERKLLTKLEENMERELKNETLEVS